MPGPLRYSSWWAELVKFQNSDATEPQDKIYALLGISSDANNSSFPKANYEENIQDVVFNTSLFFLALINQEVKPRRSARSDVLGKAKVMSYEDLEKAKVERAAKETAKEAKKAEKAVKKAVREANNAKKEGKKAGKSTRVRKRKRPVSASVL